jgi:hypothetical protein
MKKSTKIFLIAFAILVTLLIIFIAPEQRKEFNSTHFRFFFSSSIDKEQIVSLSKVLESNYTRIENDLAVTPAPSIEVNIYAHRWRYIKATGNWNASGNIEGISKLHFVNEAWGEAEVQKVAIHEFARTITLKLLLDREAQQFVDPKTLPYFNDGQHPCIDELNSRLMGGKIYSCGYTIIEYILENYGREALISLIKNYGNLQTTLQVSDNDFCNRWYAFVKQKYLKLR